MTSSTEERRRRRKKTKRSSRKVRKTEDEKREILINFIKSFKKESHAGDRETSRKRLRSSSSDTSIDFVTASSSGSTTNFRSSSSEREEDRSDSSRRQSGNSFGQKACRDRSKMRKAEDGSRSLTFKSRRSRRLSLKSRRGRRLCRKILMQIVDSEVSESGSDSENTEVEQSPVKKKIKVKKEENEKTPDVEESQQHKKTINKKIEKEGSGKSLSCEKIGSTTDVAEARDEAKNKNLKGTAETSQPQTKKNVEIKMDDDKNRESQELSKCKTYAKNDVIEKTKEKLETDNDGAYATRVLVKDMPKTMEVGQSPIDDESAKNATAVSGKPVLVRNISVTRKIADDRVLPMTVSAKNVAMEESSDKEVSSKNVADIHKVILVKNIFAKEKSANDDKSLTGTSSAGTSKAIDVKSAERDISKKVCPEDFIDDKSLTGTSSAGTSKAIDVKSAERDISKKVCPEDSIDDKSLTSIPKPKPSTPMEMEKTLDDDKSLISKHRKNPFGTMEIKELLDDDKSSENNIVVAEKVPPIKNVFDEKKITIDDELSLSVSAKDIPDAANILETPSDKGNVSDEILMVKNVYARSNRAKGDEEKEAISEVSDGPFSRDLKPVVKLPCAVARKSYAMKKIHERFNKNPKNVESNDKETFDVAEEKKEEYSSESQPMSHCAIARKSYAQRKIHDRFYKEPQSLETHDEGKTKRSPESSDNAKTPEEEHTIAHREVLQKSSAESDRSKDKSANSRDEIGDGEKSPRDEQNPQSTVISQSTTETRRSYEKNKIGEDSSSAKRAGSEPGIPANENDKTIVPDASLTADESALHADSKEYCRRKIRKRSDTGESSSEILESEDESTEHSCGFKRLKRNPAIPASEDPTMENLSGKITVQSVVTLSHKVITVHTESTGEKIGTSAVEDRRNSDGKEKKFSIENFKLASRAPENSDTGTPKKNREIGKKKDSVKKIESTIETSGREEITIDESNRSTGEILQQQSTNDENSPVAAAEKGGALEDRNTSAIENIAERITDEISPIALAIGGDKIIDLDENISKSTIDETLLLSHNKKIDFEENIRESTTEKIVPIPAAIESEKEITLEENITKSITDEISPSSPTEKMTKKIDVQVSNPEVEEKSATTQIRTPGEELKIENKSAMENIEDSSKDNILPFLPWIETEKKIILEAPNIEEKSTIEDESLMQNIADKDDLPDSKENDSSPFDDKSTPKEIADDDFSESNAEETCFFSLIEDPDDDTSLGHAELTAKEMDSSVLTDEYASMMENIADDDDLPESTDVYSLPAVDPEKKIKNTFDESDESSDSSVFSEEFAIIKCDSVSEVSMDEEPPKEYQDLSIAPPEDPEKVSNIEASKSAEGSAEEKCCIGSDVETAKGSSGSVIEKIEETGSPIVVVEETKNNPLIDEPSVETTSKVTDDQKKGMSIFAMIKRIFVPDEIKDTDKVEGSESRMPGMNEVDPGSLARPGENSPMGVDETDESDAPLEIDDVEEYECMNCDESDSESSDRERSDPTSDVLPVANSSMIDNAENSDRTRIIDETEVNKIVKCGESEIEIPDSEKSDPTSGVLSIENSSISSGETAENDPTLKIDESVENKSMNEVSENQLSHGKYLDPKSEVSPVKNVSMVDETEEIDSAKIINETEKFQLSLKIGEVEEHDATLKSDNIEENYEPLKINEVEDDDLSLKIDEFSPPAFENAGINISVDDDDERAGVEGKPPIDLERSTKIDKSLSSEHAEVAGTKIDTETHNRDEKSQSSSLSAYTTDKIDEVSKSDESQTDSINSEVSSRVEKSPEDKSDPSSETSLAIDNTDEIGGVSRSKKLLIDAINLEVSSRVEKSSEDKSYSSSEVLAVPASLSVDNTDEIGELSKINKSQIDSINSKISGHGEKSSPEGKFETSSEVTPSSDETNSTGKDTSKINKSLPTGLDKTLGTKFDTNVTDRDSNNAPNKYDSASEDLARSKNTSIADSEPKSEASTVILQADVSFERNVEDMQVSDYDLRSSDDDDNYKLLAKIISSPNESTQPASMDIDEDAESKIDESHQIVPMEDSSKNMGTEMCTEHIVFSNATSEASRKGVEERSADIDVKLNNETSLEHRSSEDSPLTESTDGKIPELNEKSKTDAELSNAYTNVPGTSCVEKSLYDWSTGRQILPTQEIPQNDEKTNDGETRPEKSQLESRMDESTMVGVEDTESVVGSEPTDRTIVFSSDRAPASENEKIIDLEVKSSTETLPRDSEEKDPRKRKSDEPSENVLDESVNQRADSPTIPPSLVADWTRVMERGLDKIVEENLTKKYLDEGNSGFPRTRSLNQELKPYVSEISLTRDQRFVSEQRRLAAALSALGRAAAEISEKNLSSSPLEILNEAGQILANLHHENCAERRSHIAPELGVFLGAVADKSVVDDFLYDREIGKSGGKNDNENSTESSLEENILKTVAECSKAPRESSEKSGIDASSKKTKNDSGEKIDGKKKISIEQIQKSGIERGQRNDEESGWCSRSLPINASEPVEKNVRSPSSFSGLSGISDDFLEEIEKWEEHEKIFCDDSSPVEIDSSESSIEISDETPVDPKESISDLLTQETKQKSTKPDDLQMSNISPEKIEKSTKSDDSLPSKFILEEIENLPKQEMMIKLVEKIPAQHDIGSSESPIEISEETPVDPNVPISDLLIREMEKKSTKPSDFRISNISSENVAISENEKIEDEKMDFEDSSTTKIGTSDSPIEILEETPEDPEDPEESISDRLTQRPEKISVKSEDQLLDECVVTFARTSKTPTPHELCAKNSKTAIESPSNTVDDGKQKFAEKIEIKVKNFAFENKDFAKDEGEEQNECVVTYARMAGCSVPREPKNDEDISSKAASISDGNLEKFGNRVEKKSEKKYPGPAQSHEPGFPVPRRSRERLSGDKKIAEDSSTTRVDRDVEPILVCDPKFGPAASGSENIIQGRSHVRSPAENAPRDRITKLWTENARQDYSRMIEAKKSTPSNAEQTVPVPTAKPNTDRILQSLSQGSKPVSSSSEYSGPSRRITSDNFKRASGSFGGCRGGEIETLKNRQYSESVQELRARTEYFPPPLPITSDLSDHVGQHFGGSSTPKNESKDSKKKSEKLFPERRSSSSRSDRSADSDRYTTAPSSQESSPEPSASKKFYLEAEKCLRTNTEKIAEAVKSSDSYRAAMGPPETVFGRFASPKTESRQRSQKYSQDSRSTFPRSEYPATTAPTVSDKYEHRFGHLSTLKNAAPKKTQTLQDRKSEYFPLPTVPTSSSTAIFKGYEDPARDRRRSFQASARPSISSRSAPVDRPRSVQDQQPIVATTVQGWHKENNEPGPSNSGLGASRASSASDRGRVSNRRGDATTSMSRGVSRTSIASEKLHSRLSGSQGSVSNAFLSKYPFMRTFYQNMPERSQELESGSSTKTDRGRSTVDKIPEAWGTVKVQAKGAGYAILQMTVQYNVDIVKFQTPPPVKAFDLRVRPNFYGRNQSHITYFSCQRWTNINESSRSGMAVLDVTIPTGYIIQQQNLDRYILSRQVRNLKRARFQNRKVLFYFDYLDQEDTCVNFTIERWYPVANMSRYLPVRVYDYYAPERFNETIFDSLSTYILNICEVCGSSQCPYCHIYNAATLIAPPTTFVLLLSVLAATARYFRTQEFNVG